MRRKKFYSIGHEAIYDPSGQTAILSLLLDTEPLGFECRLNDKLCRRKLLCKPIIEIVARVVAKGVWQWQWIADGLRFSKNVRQRR